MGLPEMIPQVMGQQCASLWLPSAGACPGLAPLSVVIQELHLEQIFNLGASCVSNRTMSARFSSMVPAGIPSLICGQSLPWHILGRSYSGVATPCCVGHSSEGCDIAEPSIRVTFWNVILHPFPLIDPGLTHLLLIPHLTAICVDA